MSDTSDCSCHSQAAMTESKALSSTDAASANRVSRFKVTKMDCPSEERMVRLALDGVEAIKALAFDLPNRSLRVWHEGPVAPIAERLQSLGLGAEWQATETAGAGGATPLPDAATDADEARTLRWLLGINAVMFVLELTVGYLAQSAGLIADSLDMFADAAVYGLAMYTVGRAAASKLNAARVAGVLQMVLAFGVLAEVVRRFVYGSEPESALMMAMALVALVANVSCLLLISRNRDSGVHMKASWIFSANDVIANIGVIAAGALVAATGSSYPDLIIGILIGVVVLNGARKILALRN